MISNFHNKVVLITGATNGIGKEILEAFLKTKATIIATGNSTSKKSFFEIYKENNIDYHQVNFNNKKSSKDFIKKIQNYKKIDICINNAGINKINYIDKISNELDDVLNVNLKIPFQISSAVSDIMKRNKYGKIINISSIWGKKSKEKRISYSISKYALNGLTVSSSIELAKYNILVNSISPGFVDTELTRRVLSKKEINQVKKQIPIGRLAKPSEIVPLIFFLSSELNTYITGQIIYVDGGFINV
jgi:3-oxoacyl-[acyl-carrier protein] reductase